MDGGVLGIVNELTKSTNVPKVRRQFLITYLLSKLPLKNFSMNLALNFLRLICSLSLGHCQQSRNSIAFIGGEKVWIRAISSAQKVQGTLQEE